MQSFLRIWAADRCRQLRTRIVRWPGLDLRSRDHRLVVACEVEAAGPGAQNCCAHAGICALRLPRNAVLKVVRLRGLKRDWTSVGAAVKRIFTGQRVSLANAGKGRARGCLGPRQSHREAQLRPATCRLQPGPSSAQPRSPRGTHSRTPGSRRLTCQAPGSCPISCGRSTPAAMFSAQRCQSVRRRPMGGRAGGQVTVGQLAPHWRAPPGLPLRLCERSE